MERFIVSARKYRPVTFDTVVGQPHITQTLKNAIRNNHLAQAFLFTGPRGVENHHRTHSRQDDQLQQAESRARSLQCL